MKLTVSIDCTPEELRTACGLPDVKPLNDAVVEQMAKQITKAGDLFDPMKAAELWLSANPMLRLFRPLGVGGKEKGAA